MSPKPHPPSHAQSYYVATTASRDFAWLSWLAAAPRPPKSKLLQVANANGLAAGSKGQRPARPKTPPLGTATEKVEEAYDMKSEGRVSRERFVVEENATVSVEGVDGVDRGVGVEQSAEGIDTSTMAWNAAATVDNKHDYAESGPEAVPILKADVPEAKAFDANPVVGDADTLMKPDTKPELTTHAEFSDKSAPSKPKSKPEKTKSKDEVKPKSKTKLVVMSVRSSSKASSYKKSKSSKQQHGPWSEWYVSEDRKYLWRARQTPNKKWDYERKLSPNPHSPPIQAQNPPQIQITISPATSGSLSLIDHDPDPVIPAPPPPEAFSSGGLKPSPTPSLAPGAGPNSPKSSWPTIVTTSTGYPTVGLSPSTSMGTLPTLPKEVDGESGFLTASDVEPEEAGTTPGTGNGIVKGGVVVTADGSSTSPSGQGQIVHVNGLPVVVSKKMLKARRLATSLNIAHSQPRIRPPSIYNAVNPTIINPAVRSRASLLLYPGRPLTHTTHTRLSVKQLAAAKQRQKRKKKEEEAAEKARLAYAKRFDKKIRGDKVVQVDFRKRVRLWMKGVQAAIGEEGFGEVEFDGEGLPIYR